MVPPHSHGRSWPGRFGRAGQLGELAPDQVAVALDLTLDLEILTLDRGDSAGCS